MTIDGQWVNACDNTPWSMPPTDGPRCSRCDAVAAEIARRLRETT